MEEDSAHHQSLPLLPDKATTALIDDVQSPLWNWEDREKMYWQRHDNRFG
jgi:hypothetical protein